MRMGELRNEILDQCPEAFRERLVDWIDDLELELLKVACDLDINATADLAKINDAQNALADICEGLY